MTGTAPEIRNQWVSYLRVSTPGQAEQELSVPAQRRAVKTYARCHGVQLSREYVEQGRSGGESRLVFKQMLTDVLCPTSSVCTILVHHTSRFSRNATQARVIKERLRRVGVKVISVSQETNDDAMGHLVEGLFECFDQYESELNGMRTAAAMREAIRQGYFPGSAPPYGFESLRVEIRTNVFRSVLVPQPEEAALVRLIFELYVGHGGAKSVARALNQRGLRYRRGRHWSKDLVLQVIDEPAVAGTYYWGKHDRGGRLRDRSEWVALEVTPLVDGARFNLVQRLRAARAPRARPGRTSEPTTLLRGLVCCAKCGASYQLESSGKRTASGEYKYRYYNCRRSCRAGVEACPGGRIPMAKLDEAILAHVARAVCTDTRCQALARAYGTGACSAGSDASARLARALDDLRGRIESWEKLANGSVAHREFAKRKLEELGRYRLELEADLRRRDAGCQLASASHLDTRDVQRAWTQLIMQGGPVAMNYLHLLIDRIEINGHRIDIIAREAP